MNIVTLTPSSGEYWPTGIPTIDVEKGQNKASQAGRVPNQTVIAEQHAQLKGILDEIGGANHIAREYDQATCGNSIVFARDTFVGNSNGTVLFSKMCNPNRIHQVAHVKKIVKKDLIKLGLRVIDAPDGNDIFFEGGDIKAFPEFMFIGDATQQSRNSEQGIRYVQEQFGYSDRNVFRIQANGYHIDTVMGFVRDEKGELSAVILSQGGIKNEQDLEAFLKTKGVPLIHVSHSHGINGDGSINGLGVNNTFLNSRTFHAGAESQLNSLGINRLVTDVTEFWLAGGGIHCLTNDIQ